MNLRATGNYLLVEPQPPAEKTSGGILLPAQWQQPEGRGTILSKGGKVPGEDLQPGAKVVFNWLERRLVEHEGRELWLLHWQHILGVVPC